MIKMPRSERERETPPRREPVRVRPISSVSRGTTRVEKNMREVKERKSR